MSDNSSHEIIGGFVGLLLVMGIVILMPILPALLYAEYNIIPIFLIPAIFAISAGMLLNHKYPLKENLSIRATVVIASAGWLYVSMIGAIPYLCIGMVPVDALFESISGFTTTGMTLMSSLEECSRSILFYRSLTQWVGGVGIILLFTILLKGGMSTWRLYTLEGREKFTPSIKTSIRDIWLIYAFLTGICAVALYISGMSPFDAINHAMTALSTGGFSTKTSSVVEFNAIVKIILSVFMILGATSFVLFYKLIKFEFRKVSDDVEFRSLLVITVIAGSLASLLLIISGTGVVDGLVDGFFNIISILTTTGYTSSDITTWHNVTKVVLLILMVIGGSAGSTAGGVKIWRIIVLYRMVKRETEKLTLPHSAVIPIKIGGKILDDEYVMKIGTFFFAYVLFVLIEFLLLSAVVPDLFGAFSLVVSSVSNVGPAFYPVSGLNWFGKTVLITGMWFGRLELLPVMALLGRELPQMIMESYSRRKKSELKTVQSSTVTPSES
ncbi:MAG: TrkH family potassium uptake protein [Candidatus Methanomethylicaceae archaeon]